MSETRSGKSIPEGAESYNVALVGASSLKGKEIKAVLGERHFPARRMVLLDEQDLGVQLTEFEDEPAIIQPVGKESFEDIALAIFASSPAFTKDHWQMAESSGCDIIDASYFLETHPAVNLQAPAVEGLWEGAAGASNEAPAGSQIHVPAHPVSVAIAAVLGNLSLVSAVQRSVVTVYEPVSEHGQAGVEELHRQTTKLLAFQPIPRAVFDSQVAFNMLARYGEESRPTLHDAQQRIFLHAVALLKGRAAAPALRVFHAPVFFGQAFSCFVEMKEPAAPEALEDALDRKPLSVCRDVETQPSVVGIAGSDDIVIGRVEKDPACETGYWIWGALDNLRLVGINTADIAERLVAGRSFQQIRNPE